MTNLLKRAFDELSRLPESEQDAMAEWLLEEMTSDQRWQSALSGSGGRLAELAREALGEHRAGRTRALDPDSL